MTLPTDSKSWAKWLRRSLRRCSPVWTLRYLSPKWWMASRAAGVALAKEQRRENRRAS